LQDFEISLSTLRFGKCAKKIENVVKSNIVAGYNKEALQKIVNSYEKQIAAYKEQIAALNANNNEKIDFMKNFGDFSEEMMQKMMEKMGDAKGNLNDIFNQKGGRQIDMDLLRQLKSRKAREGLLTPQELEDARMYLDKLEEKPGIVYRLNENLFKDESEEEDNDDDNDDINRAANNNQDDLNDKDKYFEVSINGQIKKFEKFVVYDENGDRVFKEDLFDQDGNLKSNLQLFDAFGNPINIHSLVDANGNWKIKSKYLNKRTSKGKVKDRKDRLFKELWKVINSKWKGESSVASLKNEQFLAPQIFEKFKEKLEREEVLENKCKDFFEFIRLYIEELYKRTANMMEEVSNSQNEQLVDYCTKLIKHISDIKHKMEFYERPKRIKRITDEELDEYSGRLRKMVRVYQEEKMRRKIILELEGDNPNLVVNLGELDEDMIGLGNVKKEIAESEKFQNKSKTSIQNKFNELLNWKAKRNISAEIDSKDQELADEIDRIYDDNYNIQNFFYSYSNNVQRNSKILENKILFLSEELTKKFLKREENFVGKKKPIKVWRRRLSVRPLKEKKLRPMFKKMNEVAKSDLMYLFKNMQDKIDNFMKVQNDLKKLGTQGAIDDIKNVIASMDGGAELMNNIAKVNKEIKPQPPVSITETATEHYDTEYITNSNTITIKEKAKNKKKKKVNRGSKRSSIDENYSSMSSHQYPQQYNSNYTENSYDKNLEKVYGIKKNQIFNKFTPMNTGDDFTKVDYSRKKQPSYNEIYDKKNFYSKGSDHLTRSKTVNQKNYDSYYQQEKELDNHYEDENEEYEDEDVESINESDDSDVSNPYNVKNGQQNEKQNMSENDDEEEEEYEEYDEEEEDEDDDEEEEEDRNYKSKNSNLEQYYKYQG
jgi:hypothetical protein